MFLSHQPAEIESELEMDNLWKWRGRVSKIILQLTSRVESDKKFPHLIVHPDENGVGHSHKPVLRPRSRRGR